jgi:hypothetical protein
MSNSSNKKKTRRSLLVQKRGYPFSYIVRSSSFPKMATPQETFQESFLYPLFLLVIGALISGVLVAKLTNKWENNKKKLEIKVDIVSKIDETIMHQIGKAVLLVSQKKKSLIENERNAHLEHIHKWYTLEAKGIESKLDTYFPETNLNDRWNRYAHALIPFENLLLVYLFESDPHRTRMNPYLNEIIEYIQSTRNKAYGDLVRNLSSNFNNALVSDIIAMFYVEGDNMKRNIMKTPIKLF